MSEPIVLRPARPLPAWVFRAWELLAPRIPRSVMRWIGRFFLRFRPGSRPRRWFLLVLSEIIWDATARTRFDLVLPIWDPECAWHSDATARSLGFDEVYRGHEGVRRSLSQFNEVWKERSFTMCELLDGGDTIVMRMSIFGRGAHSGVPSETTVSAVARLDPFIVDYQNFFDDAAALREAGFDAVAPGGIRRHERRAQPVPCDGRFRFPTDAGSR